MVAGSKSARLGNSTSKNHAEEYNPQIGKRTKDCFSQVNVKNSQLQGKQVHSHEWINTSSIA